MPVRFKGKSEYHSKFKWRNLFGKKGLLSNSEMRKLAAGTPSPGSLEPPLQHKKRLEGPSTTLSCNFFETNHEENYEHILLGNQEKFSNNICYKPKASPASCKRRAFGNGVAELINVDDQHEDNEQELPPPPPVVDTKQFCVSPVRKKLEVAQDDKENQRKGHSSKQAPKSKNIVKWRKSNLKQKQAQTNSTSTGRSVLKPKLSIAKDKLAPKVPDLMLLSPSPTPTHQPEDINKNLLNDGKDSCKGKSKSIPGVATSNDASPPPAPRPEPLNKNENAEVGDYSTKEVCPREAWGEQNAENSHPVIEPQECGKPMQTEMEDNYAMKYKARLTAPRPLKKASEYQKAFTWKTPEKNVPILAAEQVVFNSSASIAAAKTDVVPKITEYTAQFRPWESINYSGNIYPVKEAEDILPKQESKMKRSKSVGALPAVGEEKVGSEMSLQNFPKGRKHHFTTEYKSNFKSPSKYGYAKGAWIGADPPHLLPGVSGEEPSRDEAESKKWFNEVLDLRQKADEYRRRAQSTHFSIEHLVQLMAKQASLWDAVSSHSSQSDNKLADVSHSQESPAEETKIMPNSHSIRVGEQPEKMDVEKDGRISTPKLYRMKGRRHHLDRTTPSVGGALLTTPTKLKKLKSTFRSLQDDDNDPTESIEEPQVQPLQSQPKHYCQTCPVNNHNLSPTFGKPTKDTHVMRNEERFYLPQSSSKLCVTNSGDMTTTNPNTELEIPSVRPSQTETAAENPVSLKTSPMKVLPTIQEHMGQTYNVIQKEQNCTPLTAVNGEGNDDDDDVSARSVASSCSVASEVLERVRKREKEFWGPNGVWQSRALPTKPQT